MAASRPQCSAVTLPSIAFSTKSLRSGNAEAGARAPRRERAGDRHELDQFGVAGLDDARAELAGDAGNEQSHQSVLTKRS